MSITWDEALESFENLVKFAAKKTYSEGKANIDLDRAIEPQDLYQIGMMKLFDCWQKYKDKPIDEFKAIFSVSLFRTVRKSLKSQIDDELEVTEIYVGEKERGYDQVLFMECMNTLLDELESPIAKAVLFELIDPSPRTNWEVWADKARKTCIKNQNNVKVNIPTTNDVKMKHIRNALNITTKEFDLAIKEVRYTAKKIFKTEGAFGL